MIFQVNIAYSQSSNFETKNCLGGKLGLSFSFVLILFKKKTIVKKANERLAHLKKITII